MAIGITCNFGLIVLPLIDPRLCFNNEKNKKRIMNDRKIGCRRLQLNPTTSFLHLDYNYCETLTFAFEIDTMVSTIEVLHQIVRYSLIVVTNIAGLDNAGR